MRQILFEVPIQGDWNLGPLGHVPGFGFGFVLLMWTLVGAFSMYQTWKRDRSFSPDLKAGIVWWAFIAVAIVLLPKFIPRPSLPVYGYGAMLVAAALFSGWIASLRAKLVGVNPEFAWDLTIKVILAGVVGARLFHLIQYHDKVFKDCRTAGEVLIAIVNLPDGGLVLYGGLILATLTYVVVCLRNRVDPVKFGDAAIPAVFIGMCFGRLGCLLNGCCFGGACALPWAITFPAGTVPWKAMVTRGFLSPEAAATMPLHPTQIYSSLNGLMLAALLTVYYPYRKGKGSVVALALILYPITRICLEILRNDEQGQLGTQLTISQLVSLCVLSLGLCLAWWSWTRSETELTSKITSTPAA